MKKILIIDSKNKKTNYTEFLINQSKERTDKSINKSSSYFQNSKFELQFDLNKFINNTIHRQSDFCLNPKKYYNQNIENNIVKRQIEINQYYFKMFVYDYKKRFDIASDSIIKSQNWEKSLSLEMTSAIKYYA